MFFQRSRQSGHQTAKPHSASSDSEMEQAAARDSGLNIHMKRQPPNSPPDFNLLDLKFLNAIQRRSMKDQESPTSGNVD